MFKYAYNSNMLRIIVKDIKILEVTNTFQTREKCKRETIITTINEKNDMCITD